jgi:hypothetical protein
LQEKEFSFTKKLLFDGESSLRSKINQQIIKNQLNIDCFADPYFKRSMAERSVREFKTRMAIQLEQIQKNQKKNINFKPWKEHVNTVVNSININKKTYRSKLSILVDYFTQKPTPSLPQNQNQLYLYDIGEKVQFFITKAERQQLGFKYSLSYGNIKQLFIFRTLKRFILFLCLGGLSPLNGIILNRRLSRGRQGIFVPYYTVKVGNKVLTTSNLLIEKNNFYQYVASRPLTGLITSPCTYTFAT